MFPRDVWRGCIFPSLNIKDVVKLRLVCKELQSIVSSTPRFILVQDIVKENATQFYMKYAKDIKSNLGGSGRFLTHFGMALAVKSIELILIFGPKCAWELHVGHARCTCDISTDILSFDNEELVTLYLKTTPREDYFSLIKYTIQNCLFRSMKGLMTSRPVNFNVLYFWDLVVAHLDAKGIEKAFEIYNYVYKPSIKAYSWIFEIYTSIALKRCILKVSNITTDAWMEFAMRPQHDTEDLALIADFLPEELYPKVYDHAVRQGYYSVAELCAPRKRQKR